MELAQGDGKKVCKSERENLAVAPRPLCGPAVSAGEPSPENLTVKRAGLGIAPTRWWDIIGTLRRAYATDGRYPDGGDCNLGPAITRVLTSPSGDGGC